VVPQYDDDVELVMNHVRASRIVYERCSVRMVDSIEVLPGLRLPTLDYMRRLWTTAEMSSMLANPSVNYASFVQLTHFTMDSMIVATSAPMEGQWTKDNLVAQYAAWYAAQVETKPMLSGVMRTQAGLWGILTSYGFEYLPRKYGRTISSWLGATTATLPWDPAPISDEEQHALITAYHDSGSDGRNNEHVRAILADVQKSKRMPKHWPFAKHFKGILLLASEVVRHVLQLWKWNRGCYKSVLQRLGEKFPDDLSAADLGSNEALQCFSEADVAKVKAMMTAARRCVRPPVTMDGLAFHAVPDGHSLSVRYPVPRPVAGGALGASVAELLSRCTLEAPSLDDASQPLRSVSLNVILMERGAGLGSTSSSSAQLIGPTASVTLSVEGNAAAATCHYECGTPACVTSSAATQQHVSLKEGQVWFNMMIVYSCPSHIQTPLTLLVARRAWHVTAARLAQLHEALLAKGLAVLREFQTDLERETALQATECREALLDACARTGIELEEGDVMAMAGGGGGGDGGGEAQPGDVVDDRPERAPEDAAAEQELQAQLAAGRTAQGLTKEEDVAWVRTTQCSTHTHTHTHTNTHTRTHTHACATGLEGRVCVSRANSVS
jgi:hypothetical protein